MTSLHGVVMYLLGFPWYFCESLVVFEKGQRAEFGKNQSKYLSLFRELVENNNTKVKVAGPSRSNSAPFVLPVIPLRFGRRWIIQRTVGRCHLKGRSVFTLVEEKDMKGFMLGGANCNYIYDLLSSNWWTKCRLEMRHVAVGLLDQETGRGGWEKGKGAETFVLANHISFLEWMGCSLTALSICLLFYLFS